MHAFRNIAGPVFFSALQKAGGLIVLLVKISIAFSQSNDSAVVLKAVRIAALKKQNGFTSPSPLQTIQQHMLQQINANSVGDAARYFSGVLVKDYGGLGGLKTISVRSLGASNTGILYDGIPVSDQQSGQIDLSRFSTSFIQSLELQQGSMQYALSPARAYASAAVLAIITQAFDATAVPHQQWQAGLKAGSFNSWQPFAGIAQPIKKHAFMMLNAEALVSKGNYPVNIENGNFSEKTRRSNTDLRSFQSEANFLQTFADSATLQLKAGAYTSARGLPGAIVFFNERSVQQLANTDIFLQGRYRKNIGKKTAVLGSAKYSNGYTRYTDPDYLNNQGGLDNRYRQQEVYVSVAAGRQLGSNWKLSAASDASFNTLSANLANFAQPRRTSFWESISLQYTGMRWQLNSSLLYTAIHDKTAVRSAADKDKLTPAIALGVRPSAASRFLLRAFYKAVYRMPTFNELYYTLIGNNSLKPEYAKQYNAGITWAGHWARLVSKLNISADAYYNEVSDKIVAVPNKNLFVWTMLNLGKVHIKGIDLNLEARGNLSAALGWISRIAYTWQQALDNTDPAAASYKNRIPYTPDHSGSAMLAFSYMHWEAGSNLLFSGKRYTLGENNVANRLPGWLTQDLFISRDVTLKHCALSARVGAENIYDTRYDIIRYFPMPGRLFKISLLFHQL